jgi:hypothetical protein
VPLAPPEGPFTGYPVFSAPPQVAAGLGFAGSARTEEEAATPRVYRVRPAEGGDVPVAHLSYTYGFNGFQPPEGREWAANLIDEDAILDEAARAHTAGAEIVVLSMHWGTEYAHDAHEPTTPSARWRGWSPPTASTSSWATTRTWCSRWSRSVASGWCTGWATRSRGSPVRPSTRAARG